MATVSKYIVERAPDQIRDAFQGILSLCESKGISRVTLVVPQKRGWDRTIVGEFLGPAVAKALLKGQPVAITKSSTLTLESTQTFRGNGSHGLLVGAHISVKDMSKLDDSWDARAIMYLPWNDTEGQEWHAIWNPETIGPRTQNPLASSLPTPVEEALSRLTQTINLGTGLSHPSDRKHAERVIANLHAGGHSFEPVEVRRWAQRNGWSSNAAAELEVLARKRQ
jgi:hypothetical protein